MNDIHGCDYDDWIVIIVKIENMSKYNRRINMKQHEPEVKKFKKKDTYRQNNTRKNDKARYLI